MLDKITQSRGVPSFMLKARMIRMMPEATRATPSKRVKSAATSATTGCGSAGPLGRRCPAAYSRGVTLTSGVTGSADPNINRRSGGSASLQIP
jgi:hypothetical protein